MTEMKRVPYRISQREEGEMFEEFSYSSDFERQPSIAVGAGLIPAA